MTTSSRILCVSATTWIIAFVISIIIPHYQRSTWWVGYDLQNCPDCTANIDWSNEFSAEPVTESLQHQFENDGVVILPSAISVSKVESLGKEVDSLPTTFMTDIIAKFFLKHYAKYEHRIDTRSEIVRDWAIHGPLGRWAAQLMNATEVRLYNAESIYHKGEDSPVPCSTAWHRDTIAAPFAPSVKSITFNVYLNDIGAEGEKGDVLVYMLGSHKESTPKSAPLYRPNLKMGDILAHDPNTYHTPSGEGCWKRRSIQFRYFSAKFTKNQPTTFEFGPNRIPYGIVPWTLAHAPEIAPHSLQNGDALQGVWYPRVYPSPLETEEHVPLEAKGWSLLEPFRLAGQAEKVVRSGPNGLPLQGSFGMDGVVENSTDWKFRETAKGVELPCHKHGMFCKSE